jgi:hypothetical protein
VAEVGLAPVVDLVELHLDGDQTPTAWATRWWFRAARVGLGAGGGPHQVSGWRQDRPSALTVLLKDSGAVVVRPRRTSSCHRYV